MNFAEFLRTPFFTRVVASFSRQTIVLYTMIAFLASFSKTKFDYDAVSFKNHSFKGMVERCDPGLGPQDSQRGFMGLVDPWIP